MLVIFEVRGDLGQLLSLLLSELHAVGLVVPQESQKTGTGMHPQSATMNQKSNYYN